MKTALTTVIIAVCALCHAQDPQEKQVDELISSMTQQGRAGVTVAVAEGDDILYSKGYGLANAEYDIPNTSETIFHVASLSKQFTAFAIALLADQGKVALDDDIRVYLPELHDFGHTITIRHLIHHTSGLRDQWNLLALAGWRLDDVITRTQVLRLISRQEELNFTPGDEFLYCNTGYTLLGEIVSRVTGKSFSDWCSANIFQPLAMDHTLFYDDHERIVRNRAYSYHDSPTGLKKSVLSYANAGATSLFTTAEDLTKWSDNFRTMKVGNDRVMRRMEERGVLNKGDTLGYAFGQGIGIHKGLKAFSHGGADAGYRTFLLRFPDHQLSIAVLSNYASFNPGKLAYGIAGIYLKEHLKETAKKPEIKQTVARGFQVSEALLKLYEGQYQLTPDMIVTIKAANGKLTAQGTGQPALSLVASTESEFSADGHDIIIAFKKSGDTEVSAFTLFQGGQTLVAPRIKPFDPASLDLESYVGNYYSPELETHYTVGLKGDTLSVNHIRHDPAAMTPVGRDAFSTGVWFMGKIEFKRNNEGKIAGFKVSSGRVRNVWFVKR